MSSGSLVARRPLLVAAACALVGTVALLPLASRQLGPTVSFMPAMLTVVACFDVLSVYLLVGDYHDLGDRRLLMMSWAYAWSLVTMAGYALAFPGAVSTHPPLAATQSVAPYLYLAWHGGFPILLGLAWAPWPAHWVAPTEYARRRLISTCTLTIAVTMGVLAVALVARFAHRLPPLIVGLDTSRLTTLTAPIVIPLVLLALAFAIHGTRGRTGPERWSSIAILICLCDLGLTYDARRRFSLGWYAGRSLTLVASAILLLAMLTAFRRLKAQAEHHAAYDSLTGLHNRRTVYQALDHMIASARRSHTPASVIGLDLDLFKSINDRHGHEAGDAVLAEVGRILMESHRRGDVAARVGGEEFLVLLPRTDAQGALVVAEKIRARIASMQVPGLIEPVTASLGAAALRDTDLSTRMLLRRVDHALYEAKHGGRNQSILAPAEDGLPMPELRTPPARPEAALGSAPDQPSPASTVDSAALAAS